VSALATVAVRANPYVPWCASHPGGTTVPCTACDLMRAKHAEHERSGEPLFAGVTGADIAAVPRIIPTLDEMLQEPPC
jgi:hypothetical protein